GQACAAIKRLYVHRDVHEPIVAKLVELAQAAKLGDPFDPETTMGPLMTGEQFAKVSDLVDDVRAVGGRIVTGGERFGEKGFFFEPTIVEDLPSDARLIVEEQFGPVLPVIVYDD